MTDEPQVQPLPGLAPDDATGVQLAAGRVPEDVTELAPATEPAPASAAAAVPPQASSTAPRRRDRALGLVAQIAGVVGIVVCLALVVGVLLGRGWATDTVTQLESDIDAKIALAFPLMDQASAKVSEVSGRVGALADAATAVADLPAPAPELRQGLRSALNRVSERYLEVRSTYGDVRQAAEGALDRLQTLERLIPAFEVPQGPVDAMARLDSGVQELDSTIMGLADAIPDTGPLTTVATAAATRATEAQAKLQNVNGVIDDARTRLGEVQTKVASTADTINSAITIASIVAILLLLYLALLHWVLLGTGRRLRRGASVG